MKPVWNWEQILEQQMLASIEPWTPSPVECHTIPIKYTLYTTLRHTSHSHQSLPGLELQPTCNQCTSIIINSKSDCTVECWFDHDYHGYMDWTRFFYNIGPTPSDQPSLTKLDVQTVNNTESLWNNFLHNSSLNCNEKIGVFGGFHLAHHVVRILTFLDVCYWKWLHQSFIYWNLNRPAFLDA